MKFTYFVVAFFLVACAAPAEESLEASVTGLRAVYFDNENFTGKQVRRVDLALDFNWGDGSPAPGIAPDTFSARWTGSITPKYSEVYTFTATADDGVRLWVNGVNLIDDWTYQPNTERKADIKLTANQRYAIKIEYYDGVMGASLKLEWNSTSQPREVISGQLSTDPGTTTNVVTVYKDKHFGGISQTFAVGSVAQAQLNQVGDNAISSLRVPPGVKLLACEHDTAPRGVCQMFGPGDYTELGELNERISRLEVRPNTENFRATSVITYPAPAGAPISNLYKVRVNGLPVAVYGFAPYDGTNDPLLTPDQGWLKFRGVPGQFAMFDMQGSVTVEVERIDGRPVANLVVRPLSAGITPKVTGNKITFTVKKASNLSVEFDDPKITEPLYIFSNAFAFNRPQPGAANVRFFGPGIHDLGIPSATESGVKDGTVIRLQPGERVYIDGGAVLKNVQFECTTNNTVEGRGILAAVDNTGRIKNGSREQIRTGFWCDGGKNFKLRDLIMVRSVEGWQNVLRRVDGFEITNYRTLGDARGDDGISLMSSKNGILDNVFIRSRDDSLVIKDVDFWVPPRGNTTYPGYGVSNITVQNSVIFNGVFSSNLEIGHELFGEDVKIENITFRNIDLIHGWSYEDDGAGLSYAAMSIHMAGNSSVSNITYDNIRVEDLDPWQSLIELRIGKPLRETDPAFDDFTFGNFGKGPTSISNIMFSNITYTGSQPTQIRLRAWPGGKVPKENRQVPAIPINGVTLKNIKVGGSVITSPSDPRIRIEGQVNNLKVY
jgi:hypothetical protein